MRYQILESKYVDQLAAEVNAAIEDGWVPQGGVMAYNHNGEPIYYQAVQQPPKKAVIK